MNRTLDKIRTFREALGTHPLAIASGITPENVAAYAPLVDMILVATGINFKDDFYNIDPARLTALLAAIEPPTRESQHDRSPR
jgi:predicted TIM-barrel enzyme